MNFTCASDPDISWPAESRLSLWPLSSQKTPSSLSPPSCPMTSSQSQSQAQNARDRLVRITLVVASVNKLTFWIAHYVNGKLAFRVPVGSYLKSRSLGLWGPLDPSKHRIQTLPDIFISGLSKGKDRPFLGHRPVVSKQPLKFANHFEWQTYGQVDVRRRKIGSAMVHLFKTGELGGGDLETVGIWSINRPGNLFLHICA
jgi:hypothetical protein